MTESTEVSQPSTPSSPRTLIAEFKDPQLGRKFIAQLQAAEITIGVYSINAPTKDGGCKVAVQVQSEQIERAINVVKEMGGTPGATSAPKRQPKEEQPSTSTPSAPTEQPNEQKEESNEMATKSKSKAKKAAPAKAKAAKRKVIPLSERIKDPANTCSICKAKGFADVKKHKAKNHPSGK